MRRVIAFAFIAGLIVSPRTASAHLAFPGAGSVYAGALHPFTVPAHLLILVGIALYLGHAERLDQNFLFFSAAFVAGLIIAVLLRTFEVPQVFLLAAAASIGTVLAADLTLPRPLLLLFVMLPAFMIGLDSGPGDVPVKTLLLAAIGIFVSVHFLVFDLAFYRGLLKKKWMHIGVRVVGSWIAASAIMVLALSLRHVI